MGNSKSIRKQHKKNNSKTQKELCDEIRNYLSENRQITIEDESEPKVNLFGELYAKVEKSNLENITDSHHIIELSLDLISRNSNVEIYKKTNEIIYTSLMYPPIFESDEKAASIISTKTSNYILAQRAFDKIRDVLMINEDGEYVPKDKTLRYKYSSASQGSGSQQKGLHNQSFLSFFHNNLNVSTTSYTANNTDLDKGSVRNFKRNSSVKSNVFNESKKRKSTKSLRNVIVTEMSQKRKSLIKINETRTERNSIESEAQLVKELSPDVKKDNLEVHKKTKGLSNIKRINYGYEIQKNLFKKVKNIKSEENLKYIKNDTLSDVVNFRSLNNYAREGHLDLHEKLGKANYSWLKRILNLGGKKIKKANKNQIEFKINLKEIIKQTIKQEPDKKTIENGKKSTATIKRKNLIDYKNVSDTNLFNKYVEKFLGLESKTKPNKNRKQFKKNFMSISPKNIEDIPKGTIYQCDTLDNVPIPYSEETKHGNLEEMTSEYETPDESNSFYQLERIRRNLNNNEDPSENSSNSSEVYYENMTNMYQNEIEESFEENINSNYQPEDN